MNSNDIQKIINKYNEIKKRNDKLAKQDNNLFKNYEFKDDIVFNDSSDNAILVGELVKIKGINKTMLAKINNVTIFGGGDDDYFEINPSEFPNLDEKLFIKGINYIEKLHKLLEIINLDQFVLPKYSLMENKTDNKWACKVKVFNPKINLDLEYTAGIEHESKELLQQLSAQTAFEKLIIKIFFLIENDKIRNLTKIQQNNIKNLEIQVKQQRQSQQSQQPQPQPQPQQKPSSKQQSHQPQQKPSPQPQPQQSQPVNIPILQEPRIALNKFYNYVNNLKTNKKKQIDKILDIFVAKSDTQRELFHLHCNLINEYFDNQCLALLLTYEILNYTKYSVEDILIAICYGQLENYYPLSGHNINKLIAQIGIIHDSLKENYEDDAYLENLNKIKDIPFMNKYYFFTYFINYKCSKESYKENNFKNPMAWCNIDLLISIYINFTLNKTTYKTDDERIDYINKIITLDYGGKQKVVTLKTHKKIVNDIFTNDNFTELTTNINRYYDTVGKYFALKFQIYINKFPFENVVEYCDNNDCSKLLFFKHEKEINNAIKNYKLQHHYNNIHEIVEGLNIDGFFIAYFNLDDKSDEFIKLFYNHKYFWARDPNELVIGADGHHLINKPPKITTIIDPLLKPILNTHQQINPISPIDFKKLLSHDIDLKQFKNDFNKLFSANNYSEHFINWIYINKIQNFSKIENAMDGYKKEHIMIFKENKVTHTTINEILYSKNKK